MPRKYFLTVSASLLVFASLSGCEGVECEGQIRLDDGRCPCAPGEHPVFEPTADGGAVEVECLMGDGTGTSPEGCEGTLRYEDGDGDGFGNPSRATPACGAPASWVAEGSDCDDGCAVCYPGASEECDGIDNDCDPTTLEDEVSEDAVEWYTDADGDGVGTVEGDSVRACMPPPGYGPAEDCDDSCPTCLPGQAELCDGLNNDCDNDAMVDEDFACGLGETGVACTTSCGSMGTGDCSDACEAPAAEACAPPEESCSVMDDDCDGLIDEGMTAFSAPTSTLGGSPSVDWVQAVAAEAGTTVIGYREGRALHLRRISATGAPMGLETVVVPSMDGFDLVDDGADIVVVTKEGNYLWAARYSKATLGIVGTRYRINADLGDFTRDEIRALKVGSNLVVAYVDGATSNGFTVGVGPIRTLRGFSWSRPLNAGAYMTDPYEFDFAWHPDHGELAVFYTSAGNAIRGQRLTTDGMASASGAVTVVDTPPVGEYYAVVAAASPEGYGLVYGHDTNPMLFGTEHHRVRFAELSSTLTVRRPPAELPDVRPALSASGGDRPMAISYVAPRATFLIVNASDEIVRGLFGDTRFFARRAFLAPTAEGTELTPVIPLPRMSDPTRVTHEEIAVRTAASVTHGDEVMVFWGFFGSSIGVQSQWFGCR